MFWAAIDTSGRVIGGVRAKGPLTSPDDRTLSSNGRAGPDCRRAEDDQRPGALRHPRDEVGVRHRRSRTQPRRSHERWRAAAFTPWRDGPPILHGDIGTTRAGSLAFVGWCRRLDSRDAVPGRALPDQNDVVGPADIRQSCRARNRCRRSSTEISRMNQRAGMQSTRWVHCAGSWCCERRASDRRRRTATQSSSTPPTLTTAVCWIHLRADPPIEFIDRSDHRRPHWHDCVLPPDAAIDSTNPDAGRITPGGEPSSAFSVPGHIAAVRLDRNRNLITADEQRQLGALRIGVVGLSVGHAIAHTLRACRDCAASCGWLISTTWSSPTSTAFPQPYSTSA